METLILSLICLLGSGGAIEDSPSSHPSDAKKKEQVELPGSSQKPQQASAIPTPPFHNLRYEEDWSAAPRDSDGDGWRSLKHLPLFKEHAYLSLGGQMRGRSELWSDFAFRGGPDNSDAFGLLRVRLHGDLHWGRRVRLFVEGKSALADGRQLPGGLRVADVDSAALQNTFVDLAASLGGGGSLVFRAGRQELQFGKQRLVSPLDWSNTRPRMFDGLRGILRLQSWRLDGFWTRFVRVRKYSFNNHDSGIDFFGAYASGPLPDRNLKLDLYWLGIERDPSSERRHTAGARLEGGVTSTGWDFDVEAAYQFGHRGRLDLSAFMFAGQLGHSLSRLRTKPRVYLGLDYASGDKDPLDGQSGTFDQLFPLGHAYLGFIDLVGRKNIIDFNQGVSFQCLSRATCRADTHFFWRARPADALYDAAGVALRPGALESRRWTGAEMDLTWHLKLDRHTSLSVGYSHFFPGSFIRESGSAKDVDFGYVELQYTW